MTTSATTSDLAKTMEHMVVGESVSLPDDFTMDMSRGDTIEGEDRSVVTQQRGSQPQCMSLSGEVVPVSQRTAP
ncbi:hypothetical protein HAX54_018898, partial [Datura stramonium]|nr:hypothetical protein [Datura stramonium]